MIQPEPETNSHPTIVLMRTDQFNTTDCSIHGHFPQGSDDLLSSFACLHVVVDPNVIYPKLCKGTLRDRVSMKADLRPDN